MSVSSVTFSGVGSHFATFESSFAATCKAFEFSKSYNCISCSAEYMVSFVHKCHEIYVKALRGYRTVPKGV